MATAQIELRVEFEVVDENGNELESDHEDWETAQEECIEKIMEELSAFECSETFSGNFSIERA